MVTSQAELIIFSYGLSQIGLDSSLVAAFNSII